jgi:hypothetical protein
LKLTKRTQSHQELDRETIAVMPGTFQPGTFNVGDSSLNSLLNIGPATLFVANVTGGGDTVTFTTLTTAAAAGTFQFSYVASATSGATGTHAVTNGVFNVTF